MTHKGMTQADIDAAALAVERAATIAELDKLEVYVPRVVEDMIPLIPGFVVSEAKAKIMARKQELRAKLNGGAR